MNSISALATEIEMQMDSGPVALDGDEWRLVIAALRAAPPSTDLAVAKPCTDALPPASGAQPVGWRYRYSPKGAWKYADDKADCNPTPNYEQQPLYAAPQSESAPQSAIAPVAWRWRRKDEKHWNLANQPLEQFLLDRYEMVQEPLCVAIDRTTKP